MAFGLLKILSIHRIQLRHRIIILAANFIHCCGSKALGREETRMKKIRMFLAFSSFALLAVLTGWDGAGESAGVGISLD